MADTLFSRLTSFDGRPGKVRRWTGNDESGYHHHGVVSLAEDPLLLHLWWKSGDAATPQEVGMYSFFLPALLKGKYVRDEEGVPDGIRLRFAHRGELISVQVKMGAPELVVGRFSE